MLQEKETQLKSRRSVDYKEQWRLSSENLITTIVSLGFPEDLGKAVAKNLGSPKAMERMTAYLQYVKPKSAELVADEMPGIMSEIEAWRDKKARQQMQLIMK